MLGTAGTIDNLRPLGAGRGGGGGGLQLEEGVIETEEVVGTVVVEAMFCFCVFINVLEEVKVYEGRNSR